MKWRSHYSHPLMVQRSLSELDFESTGHQGKTGIENLVIVLKQGDYDDEENK